MPREEIGKFFNRVRLAPGYHQRKQALIGHSERLKVFNPMNEPDAQKRRAETQRRTWYGTPAMVALVRRNMAKAIQTIREKNLRTGKWSCPCGAVFPTRQEKLDHIKIGGCYEDES
jgi:hypothetical protein